MSTGSLRPGRRTEADTAARQDAHRFAALVRDCVAAGIARRCLVLGLSRLPMELRKPHHLRLAREALDPLLSADRAQRFMLPNHDIATLWRGSASALLESSRQAVARMFGDADEAMPEPESLWRVFELPADGEALAAVAALALRGAEPAAAATPPLEPLDAAALAALEAALARADVARFVRRRAICTRTTDGAFRIAWEVRQVAVGALCAELAPGRDPWAHPWLLARLSRTLDRRLLALLAAQHELRAARPFGLDLNVASILGQDFQRFDVALPQALRGRVTLGLTPADILADLPAFQFARDFARARGYRLLLRLPDATLLPVLPAVRLGLDLVEIVWSRSLLALPADQAEQDAGRLVLAGADGADAIGWGMAHGLTLFEGRAALPSLSGVR